MQVEFTRWCMDPKGRTPVAINPLSVDCMEEFGPAYVAATGERFPAATKVVMKRGQEYIVQGTVSEVVFLLNAKEIIATK